MNRFRILHVDPTLAGRALVRRALEREKITCEIRVAADEEECLRLLKQKPADLVLLDSDIPRRDPLDALVELGASFPGVAVALTTRPGSQELAASSLKVGAIDCVAKSESLPQAIAALVRRVIARKRLEAGLRASETGVPAPVLPGDTGKDKSVTEVCLELRNDLNCLTGYASAVAEERLGPLNPVQRHVLEVALRNAWRMRELIGEIVGSAGLELNDRTLGRNLAPVELPLDAQQYLQTRPRQRFQVDVGGSQRPAPVARRGLNDEFSLAPR